MNPLHKHIGGDDQTVYTGVVMFNQTTVSLAMFQKNSSKNQRFHQVTQKVSTTHTHVCTVSLKKTSVHGKKAKHSRTNTHAMRQFSTAEWAWHSSMQHSRVMQTTQRGKTLSCHKIVYKLIDFIMEPMRLRRLLFFCAY